MSDHAVAAAVAPPKPSPPANLPGAPHDHQRGPLQVFPALLPVAEHMPALYPFGRWPLPAAGVLFATPLSYASVTMSPLVPGHVLIMPRSNTPRFSDLSGEELCDMWLVAQHISRVFQQRLHAPAVSMAIQDGLAAGQTVSCVHIHLLPRHRKVEEPQLPADAVAPELRSEDAPIEAVAATCTGQAADPEDSSKSSAAAASGSPSSSSQRTSIDPINRIVKTRAEQAVEAREYAQWLQEAGVPQCVLKHGIEIVA